MAVFFASSGVWKLCLPFRMETSKTGGGKAQPWPEEKRLYNSGGRGSAAFLRFRCPVFPFAEKTGFQEGGFGTGRKEIRFARRRVSAPWAGNEECFRFRSYRRRSWMLSEEMTPVSVEDSTQRASTRFSWPRARPASSTSTSSMFRVAMERGAFAEQRVPSGLQCR